MRKAKRRPRPGTAGSRDTARPLNVPVYSTFFAVTDGKSSVRNGVSGRPSAL
jgi:hypothetical protein